MLVQVRCTRKSTSVAAHERIEGIGGVNADGTRWYLPIADAIAGIEGGKWSFYVERPAGHRVDVIVASTALGRKYLKTTSDGEQPNNLLELPNCP